MAKGFNQEEQDKANTLYKRFAERARVWLRKPFDDAAAKIQADIDSISSMAFDGDTDTGVCFMQPSIYVGVETGREDSCVATVFKDGRLLMVTFEPREVEALTLLSEEIRTLREEVRYLRHYGNKARTAMADEARENGELDNAG